MKHINILAVTLCLAMASFSLSAQENEKEPSLEERCEQEADRLERLLELEPWQTFYVDSILKHDYAAMRSEYDKLRASKVENLNIYQEVQDKWMDSIDKAYRKVFDDAQWALYLKQGGARAQKARDKRRESKKK